MVLIILLLVCCGLRPVTAIVGKRARPIRIGAINAGWGPTPSTAGLRDGLLALGYKENEDFILGVRFTRGDIAALPTAARELVQYGVDLIFATQESPAKAAQLATSDIPIVFASVGSPIELGLIQSFARPGGIIGVADLEFEILAKRLEIFKDLVSGLQRVLFLYNADHPYSVMAANTYREAAGHLGLTLIEKSVRTEAEAQAILAQIQHEKVEGVVQPPTPSLNLPGLVLEFATKQTIPSMFNAVFWVEQGALTSYGPDFHESGKQAARLVDKIIKGAAPADIPVEVNSKNEVLSHVPSCEAVKSLFDGTPQTFWSISC